MAKYRIEHRDLDGTGSRPTRVYPMPPSRLRYDFWNAVTCVPCPACEAGFVQWAEAGYVPGYRICDGCGRHFLAQGNADAPVLVRVRDRRSRV